VRGWGENQAEKLNLQQLIFKKNNEYLITTLRNHRHLQMNTLTKEDFQPRA